MHTHGEQAGQPQNAFWLGALCPEFQNNTFTIVSAACEMRLCKKKEERGLLCA